MASSAATEAVHTIKGIENSGNTQSLQPAFSQEVEDDLIFTINVEFCGGLEQLTEDKTKEIQLRFTRQKRRNARTCSCSSSSSGTDRSHAVSNSINGSGGGSPHACGADIAATGATARETAASHKERDISGPGAGGRSHEEDEAEESVPLYQLIGFVSSFVLSERSDMFADPYEGAPVDAAAAGAQRQHRGGQDGKSTYPIEYLLPGGFSPPMQLRPGVLALINDVDVEVLGGMEAPVHSSDCVTFISTLHGG